MLKSLVDEYLKTGVEFKLFEYLASNSHLPGPRGNLELAGFFADSLVEYSGKDIDKLWTLCRKMTTISAQEAPVNTPHEFIPFCGTVGIAAIAAQYLNYFDKTLSCLQELADDARWRMREAVAMGLQKLLTVDTNTVIKEFKIWINGNNLLRLRAIVAAVAEPALLKNKEVAKSALQINREVVQKLSETKYKKSENFRVLRKALGYTLSVVIVPLPNEGFEYLTRLSKMNDPDINWIIKENLKKNRLIKNFPKEVNSLRSMLN